MATHSKKKSTSLSETEANSTHGTGTQKTYGIFIGTKFWHERAKHRAIQRLKELLTYDTINTAGEVREMLLTTYNRLLAEQAHANATNARNAEAKVSPSAFRENSTRIY